MIAPNPLPWGDQGQVRAWLGQGDQIPHSGSGALGLAVIIAITAAAVVLIAALVLLTRRPGPPPAAHPVWRNPKIGGRL